MAGAQSRSPIAPVRDIVFARDGRLAASIDGDLWVRSSDRRSWTQLTQGPAWDRQPAWSPDGSSIVFSSNAEGQDDLYRMAVTRASSARERLTTDPAPDLEPTIGKDGTVYFIRGRLGRRLERRSA
jgi:Tol biopolymer transport system component